MLSVLMCFFFKDQRNNKAISLLGFSCVNEKQENANRVREYHQPLTMHMLRMDQVAYLRILC